MTEDMQAQLDRIEAKLDRILADQADSRSRGEREEDTRLRNVLTGDQIAALNRVIQHYTASDELVAMTASDIVERANIPGDIGRVRAVSRYLRNRCRLAERRTGERREFVFPAGDDD